MSQKGGGTGLGLCICRHIAKSHGGGISMESELGCRTCFTLRIPFDFSAAANGTAAVEEMDENDVFKGLVVLVVDNSMANRRMTVRVLEMKGAIVTAASDGLEAVEAVSGAPQGHFDVILMDE